MNFGSMKTFQIVILAIFGFLALLGLVLFANFGGFGSSSTNVGTVTIWGTLPQSSMDTILNGLRNGNQDYSGVSYVQKDESTFDADLAEALASGTGPDLILISQEEFRTEQNKLSVVPYSTISQNTFIKDYLSIEDLFLAADGTYGVPFAVDPLVLYYNRSALEQAGIPNPPTTWEAVTSMTPQMTQASGGNVTKSVVPFGAYENVENARAIVSLLLLQAGNPISSVDSTGNLRAQLTTTDAANSAVTPAQSAMNFYTQFADPVKNVYTWNRALPSARQSFLAGTLAFYPGFASELPGIAAANPNLDFDMAAIPQPQTASQQLTFGKAYAFAVPKASKNALGAEKTAFALAGPSLAQTVAHTLFMAPALRSELTPAADDRYAPVYYPQALIAKGWLSPSPAVTDGIFSTMMSNITSGRMTTGQALNTANQAINAAL